MEDENKVVETVDDSAEDAELQKQLDEINQKVAVPPASPAETKPAEEETPQISAEDTSSPVSPQEDKTEGSETQQSDEYDFKAPIRGKFESEEAYQVRVDIAQKIAERNNASSPDEYNKFQAELKELRNELKSIGSNEKIIRSHNQNDDASLNGDDVETRARQIVQQELATREISSTLNNFVSKHKELQNEVTRDVFFDFVENNFNYQGKSGPDLVKVLELARSAMFKKPESLQERVFKSANVQEKVNAMQFPGGTVAQPGLSPELQQSFEELRAQGLSDEQITTLLSD